MFGVPVVSFEEATSSRLGTSRRTSPVDFLFKPRLQLTTYGFIEVAFYSLDYLDKYETVRSVTKEMFVP